MTQPVTLDYAFFYIHESVKMWGREDGYPVIDLLRPFFGRNREELWVPGDGHPNSEAHKIAASAIAEHVRRVWPWSSRHQWRSASLLAIAARFTPARPPGVTITNQAPKCKQVP